MGWLIDLVDEGDGEVCSADERVPFGIGKEDVAPAPEGSRAFTGA